MQQVAARYTVGSIGARSTRHRNEKDNPPNPNMRGERLLPPDIRFVHAGLDIPDYTPEGVEEGFARYWDCLDQVMKDNPNRVGWGGFPMSPQLGRPRCLQLIEETQKKTGLFATCDVESIVAALGHLGAARIAIASRWKDELNRKTVEYFKHAGIEVLAITTAGQMGPEAFSMSLDTGIKLVFHLSRQAMKQAPTAEALIVPGGTWRSLGCLPILEEDFNIPVISNGTASAWRLMHDGIAPPVKGWTRLLEDP